MSKHNIRVIEILDENSIVINYGRNNGAKEDDRIRVVEIGPKIIDPYINKSLGTLDSVKATLSLTTVYERFSVCKKIEIKTTNLLTSPLNQFQSTVKTEKTLNVDKNEISYKKAPNNKVIKIGDSVEIL